MESPRCIKNLFSHFNKIGEVNSLIRICLWRDSRYPEWNIKIKIVQVEWLRITLHWDQATVYSSHKSKTSLTYLFNSVKTSQTFDALVIDQTLFIRIDWGSSEI